MTQSNQHSSNLGAGGLEGDAPDPLRMLLACQQLSAELELGRLYATARELFAAIAGASSLQVALKLPLSSAPPPQSSDAQAPAAPGRRELAEGWLLSASEDEYARAASFEHAGQPGRWPLAAFRHVERTQGPLLVEDAARDERLADDPYFANPTPRALLVLPILEQGELTALVLLENRQPGGKFSLAQLEAVSLLAGSLTSALRNALLHRQLETQLAERTRDLCDAQAELALTAQRASMAEVATNVLHNVGNVLNSINVSAGMVREKLRTSKVGGLGKAVQLMTGHAEDLGGFFSGDPRGKQLPAYLAKLAEALTGEQTSIAHEIDQLSKSVDHIKDIVATQQSYATTSTSVERARIYDLIEDALRINAGALVRHDVTVVKEFAEVPVLPLDRHRVLQILINLISNAKYAMDGVPDRPHQITIRVEAVDGVLRIRVIDNGEGIAVQNLPRIFAHGFTTRREGHGFGLHSCVLAAQAMGATLRVHSDGLGTGATFTLEIPMPKSLSS